MNAQDLKEWRERLDLSQRTAARLLDVTEQGYIKREHGKVPLSLETYFATAYLEEHPEVVKAYLSGVTSKKPA